MKKSIVIILVVMLISSCTFQTNTNLMDLVLVKETKLVTIYVKKTDQDINEMVDNISSEFENQSKGLNDMFQVSPPQKATIHIYTDKEQFRQMIGRDTEGTYDVSDNIIKVYTPSDLSRIDVRNEYTFQIIHEYVHAIIQQLNKEVGNIKWLDEGTAYYASKQLETEIKNKKYVNISVPDLSDILNSQAYFDEAGGQAYYFSGLIVQFIYEKYGEAKFNKIIREPEKMETILNRSIEDLYIEWKNYVNYLYE
ncbi:hypothetical protein [Paenibacillus dakarensis]|uniref:hypothetical protein n=1 Tax=Paenibacillus dakarensis TaxID=1527293 RepID=UPI0006D5834C|nr:hypothetical protein [Paenibacillus dakarensis]